MSSTHPCPISGCRHKSLAFGRMMCHTHWSLVPHDLKREVWDLWRTQPISEAYLQARKRAIAAVEERLATMKGAAER
jgi:hypothetical protein